MDIRQKIAKFINFAGATQEEYNSILPEIFTHNRTRMLMFSGIAIFFLAVMVVITFQEPSLGFGYTIYLIPLIITTIIYFLTQFCTQDHPLLLTILIYAFLSLMFLMAIYISAVANRAQTAGTFLAFLLAVPMLFILKPWKNICVIVFFDLLFVFAAIRLKSPDVIAIDVIDAFLFGGIGIVVSTFMSKITVENLVMKDKMTSLAERDQLTKLRNRTSYEHRIPLYPEICKRSLACVYIDANGLHELNETGGHQAGDRMLQFVAKSLQDTFGDSHTYRIGGDEFVAFAEDMDESDLTEKLKSFRNIVESSHYFVSIGYSIQSERPIQMTNLIKTAEQEMYRDKHDFYQRTGAPRRRTV